MNKLEKLKAAARDVAREVLLIVMPLLLLGLLGLLLTKLN
jgi:hypothetical protein